MTNKVPPRWFVEAGYRFFESLGDWLDRLDAKRFYRRNPGLLRELKRHGIDLRRYRWPRDCRGTPEELPMTNAVVDALAKGAGVSDPKSLLFMLIGVKTPFDGRGLVLAFDRAQTEEERSRIAAIVVQTKATGVDEWLLRVARDRSYGKARMAVLTLSHLDRFGDWINEPLMEAFEEKPIRVAEVLGLRGGGRELEFLKARRGWKGDLEGEEMAKLESALEKAIRRVERRLAKQRSSGLPGK